MSDSPKSKQHIVFALIAFVTISTYLSTLFIKHSNWVGHKSDIYKSTMNKIYNINKLETPLNDLNFTDLKPNIAEISQINNNNESVTIPHVIADRNHKILFCRIPKNGGTIFKVFFNLLNDPQSIDKLKNETDLHILQQQSRALKIHGNSYNEKLKHFIQIINDQQWRKIVVIRDPLERLVSAYLNKGHLFRRYLKHKTMNFTDFVAVFKPMIKDWNDLNGYRVLSTANNILNHFSPQYSYCNLEKTYKYFGETIFYHHSSIGKDAELLLKSMKLNVSDEWFYNWGQFGNETMFDVKSIHVTTNDINDSDKYKADFYRQYYRNKAFALKIMKLFKKDYKLFHIPYPTWVDHL